MRDFELDGLVEVVRQMRPLMDDDELRRTVYSCLIGADMDLNKEECEKVLLIAGPGLRQLCMDYQVNLKLHEIANTLDQLLKITAHQARLFEMRVQDLSKDSPQIILPNKKVRM